MTLDTRSEARVTNVENLIQTWQPNQHLYVKGDLGIGKAQLRDLEGWLDENGPHWTVLLMRNSQDEVYRSLENRLYRGMDAVEVAMGRGLSNRTSFGELEDARTGETDGAVFVLFLDERKFSYFSSAAQDRRGLGKSQWIGKLDRPAFRAMRGGGRIINAVKGTVSNINESLTRKIKAEADEQARAERERRRAVTLLLAQIEEARANIQATTTAATAFKNQYPKATGELTSPPTAQWERQLDALKTELNESNVRTSTKSFSSLANEIEGYLNIFTQYEAFDEQVAPLNEQIQGLKTKLGGFAAPVAAEATQFLEQAQQARASGERGMNSHIADASAAIERAGQVIAQEEARRRRAALRRKLIWTTILVTVAVLLIALAITLYVLNQRRKPALETARKTFSEREKTVSAEMERVYGLFERSREILGSKEKVAKRGYEGSTKKLTDHTFEDVDDLFVMSNEVERVMDEARQMIYPSNPAAKIKNMFSSSAFERGVNRITGEPLEFHRDKGLPLVIERESERTGTELPDKISMTFDKIFEAFHERTATAEENLNTIETSLMVLDDQLTKLQEQIETATKVDRELSEAAEDDGMFQTPAFFESLLPSAQADFDEADKISTVDPVQAMQTQIPSGVRKVLEGLTIAKTLKRGREQIFPTLNDCAPKLKELNYETAWMQETVAKLGEQADELFAKAAEESVAEAAEHFSAAVTGLGERAELSVKLATTLKESTTPATAQLQANIDQAREQISNKLSLPVEHCLYEHEANPDVHIGAARQLFEAAKAALQYGGVEAASEALAAIQNELRSGQGIVDKSLQHLREFEETLRARRDQYEDVRRKLPQHERLLSQARASYADSALVLQASDPAFTDASATVSSNLTESQERIEDAAKLIDRAGEKHRKGAILASAQMLESADGQCQMADERFAEIDHHCSRLDAQTKENVGELNTMDRKARGLRSGIDDAKTQQATIDEYQRVVREVELAQHEIATTTPRDPFKDAAAIDTFKEHVDILEAMIASDSDAYAEARRAVEGAFAELRIAQDLVNRARTDNIPDSPLTSAGVQAIERLEASCNTTRRALDVAHGDWKLVDEQSARLNAQLGVESAKLRGELQRAQRSVDLFEAASAIVFEATRWTGGWGVRIFGSPGSQELERARRALSQGNYSVMHELARAAQVAAQHAIQQAQREVYRKEREQARREEAARRRRQRRQSQIGGGSSFPSFPSGGGGGGGGSSSSPSGSGFSRSGW